METAATATQQPLRHWRATSDIDGLLWLALDREGSALNTLGSEVLAELEQLVDTIERKPPTGVALLSGKHGSFIAGADVREFDQVTDAAMARAQIQRVHQLFDRIERLPCPTVAAIDGVCLGGGLELALAFGYRIARDVPATRIGFPEIKLGIYPGFGGSARTITRLGGHQALPLMLQTRTLSAGQARGLGLVDQVVGEHESLRWAARRALLGKRRSREPGWLPKLVNSDLVRPLLGGYIRKATAKQARPDIYPAPYSLIEAFERHGNDRDALLRAEVDNVSSLLTGPVSRNLRRVFTLMERLKAEGKGDDAKLKLRRVHVVGAGVMGGDIAAWCALQGLEVTLQDRALAQIEPALKRARSLFNKKLKTPAARQAATGRLRADVDGTGVARADLVIEAIFENLDAKQQLFRALEAKIRPDTLLATNTSALPLRDIATALDQPERLIGLHFFNPVAQMPLVEVVFEPGLTDPALVKRGNAAVIAFNKFPLPVKSAPGFLVNRVLAAYMSRALELQREGHAMQTIDAAAEHFGMPVGPVELADQVGLDVGLSVMKTLYGDSRPELLAELQRKIDAGQLGRKSGDGFYLWKEGKAQKPARDDSVNLDALARELMQPYLQTCRDVLAEGLVADADLLDAGMIFGTGFPPHLGGPLHYLSEHPELSGHAESLTERKRNEATTGVDHE